MYLILPRPCALDVGAVGPVPLGQPGLPQVGGLDDVVVDADDLGDLGHVASRLAPI